MFITKKHISRRTVLRGTGVSVALPLLDAMIPASTALANTAAAPRPRMAFIYFPHGAVMDQWTPGTTGNQFELPSILSPLKPFQKHLTVVSGLENKSAVAVPVHAITPGTWLSCVPPRMSQDPHGGVTVDQLLARKLGRDTALPSLELATEERGGPATEERGGQGSWDRNYGDSHGRTLSFSSPSNPLPMEHHPGRVFQTLFGQANSGAERALLAREDSSVIDLVRGDARALSRDLSAGDRGLLSDYLEQVREVERRVRTLTAHDPTGLSTVSTGGGSAFDERMALQFDLLALAFQANITRVATFMMAAEVSNQSYSFMGVTDAFHALSHHQNDPAKLARLTRVQTFNTAMFARFVRRLSETPDGQGSMLENSTILFGSNMSNSNLHDHSPLPLSILGGGSRIKGNQHLRFPDHTPIANLYVNLLNRVGIETRSFGDSTGELAQI